MPASRWSSPDVVAEKADAGLEHAARPRGIGQRIRHGFQRRGDSDGQLVGQAEPDQPKPVDGIARGADLIGILIGHCHAKVRDVLGCLAQRGRVDPAEREGGLVAKQGRGHRSPLCRRHELGKRILDGRNALIKRQRLQIGGGQL